MSGMSILVVEDDEQIGAALSRALEGHGYVVRWVRSGADALADVQDSMAVVILDLGLPDADGIDICRTLRARSRELQILILTARRDEVDVVIGLDAGADDYIVKPFSLAELLARLRVCERRETRADRVVVAELEIVVSTHRVTLCGERLELSPKEFDLLAMLARNAGDVVRRVDILESIWKEQWYGSTKTVDTHVWSLRRKLDRPGCASWISTVRGVGYRMERR
jgi:two-component system response regulator RegX3